MVKQFVKGHFLDNSDWQMLITDINEITVWLVIRAYHGGNYTWFGELKRYMMT